MERTKERIKLETEMLRFIVVAMVALGGGSISLLLGEWTSFRLTLAGLGLIATLGLNLATWKQYQRITRLIERLPEEKT
jgi:hypothetical protein